MDILSEILAIRNTLLSAGFNIITINVNEKLAEDLKQYFATQIGVAHETEYGNITRIYDMAVMICIGFNPDGHRYTLTVVPILKKED